MKFSIAFLFLFMSAVLVGSMKYNDHDHGHSYGRYDHDCDHSKDEDCDHEVHNHEVNDQVREYEYRSNYHGYDHEARDQENTRGNVDPVYGYNHDIEENPDDHVNKEVYGLHHYREESPDDHVNAEIYGYDHDKIQDDVYGYRSQSYKKGSRAARNRRRRDTKITKPNFSLDKIFQNIVYDDKMFDNLLKCIMKRPCKDLEVPSDAAFKEFIKDNMGRYMLTGSCHKGKCGFHEKFALMLTELIVRHKNPEKYNSLMSFLNTYSPIFTSDEDEPISDSISEHIL